MMTGSRSLAVECLAWLSSRPSTERGPDRTGITGFHAADSDVNKSPRSYSGSLLRQRRYANHRQSFYIRSYCNMNEQVQQFKQKLTTAQLNQCLVHMLRDADLFEF